MVLQECGAQVRWRCRLAQQPALHAARDSAQGAAGLLQVLPLWQAPRGMLQLRRKHLLQCQLPGRAQATQAAGRLCLLPRFCCAKDAHHPETRAHNSARQQALRRVTMRVQGCKGGCRLILTLQLGSSHWEPLKVYVKQGKMVNQVLKIPDSFPSGLPLTNGAMPYKLPPSTGSIPAEGDEMWEHNITHYT